VPDTGRPRSSSLRDLTPVQMRLLGAAVLVGTVVRCWLASDRAYYGDEAGTALLIDESYRHLMTHFGGHLTMNLFLVFEKAVAAVVGEGPFRLGILSLLASVASIPLVAAVGVRMLNPAAAVSAAALVAANPFLLWFAPTARVYAVVSFLVLLQWYAFLVWSARPSRASRAGLAGASLALCAMHLLGAYHVVAIAFVMGAEALGAGRARGERVREVLRTSVWAVPAALVLAALYVPLWSQIAEFRALWSAERPTSLGYVPHALGQYFAKAPWLWVSLAALAAGVFSLAAARRDSLLRLGAWIAIPPLLGSLAGVSHNSWGHARFLIGIVPGLLLLLAAGIAAIADAAPVRWKQAALPVVLVTVIASWTPTFERHLERRDGRWHDAAAWIDSQRSPGDRVVVLNKSGNLQIAPYFKHSPEALVELGAFGPARLRGEHPSRVFVLSSRFRPPIAADEHRFGRISLWVLPGGPEDPWIDLLWDGLLAAVREEPDQARVFLLHRSLMELAILRGDSDAAERHRALFRSTRNL
jgi:hypothetical protein